MKMNIKKVFRFLEIALLYISGLTMIGLSFYTHIYTANEPKPAVGLIILMIAMLGFSLSKTFQFKRIAVNKASPASISAGTGCFCIAFGIVFQLTRWLVIGKFDTTDTDVLMPIGWCSLIECICCLAGIFLASAEDGEKYEYE